jgi:predicted RNase H-like HicB family nuclease
MTLYHAYLEEDSSGRCLAHVPDLAGCTAAGEDRSAALAALPAAIQWSLDWCASHGDPLPQDSAIAVAVSEVARGYGSWQRGGANALFSTDRTPLGDPELRTYLRRLSYLRGDLLAWVRSPAPDAGSAALTADGTIHETLSHIAATETWYLSRLGQRIVVEAGEDDVVTRLVDGRARAVEAILRLSPRQRDLVYVPTESPSNDPEEPWTLRKVLRRMLEHELDHFRALQHSGLAEHQRTG